MAVPERQLDLADVDCGRRAVEPTLGVGCLVAPGEVLGVGGTELGCSLDHRRRLGGLFPFRLIGAGLARRENGILLVLEREERGVGEHRAVAWKANDPANL